MCLALSLMIKNVFNDASVGLFRVQEHIFKRLPAQIAETERLNKTLRTKLELVNADLEEALQSCQDGDYSCASLSSCADLAREAVELAQSLPALTPSPSSQYAPQLPSSRRIKRTLKPSYWKNTLKDQN